MGFRLVVSPVASRADASTAVELKQLRNGVNSFPYQALITPPRRAFTWRNGVTLNLSTYVIALERFGLTRERVVINVQILTLMLDAPVVWRRG